MASKIEEAAKEFVWLAEAEPYDWPEPMSDELYEAYLELARAVIAEEDGDLHHEPRRKHAD